VMGPLFLLFFPALLVHAFRKPSKPLVGLALFALIYGGFLFTQSQYTRFFLSVAPVMSVAAGAMLERLKSGSRLLRQAVLAAVALVFLIHTGIFVYRTRDSWSVALGKTSATDHLLAHVRSFRGNEYLRKQMKDGEQLLFAGDVQYFYNENKNVIWDCFPLRVVLHEEGRTLAQFLSGERVDYVWVGEEEDPAKTPHPAWALNKEVWDLVRERGYELAYQYEFKEGPTTFKNYIYRRERVAEPGRIE
jgi:hypothetical protein